MSEVGVELANASTSRLTNELAGQAQVLVTMGCGDQCPIVPGARREDWPLEDPKGKPIERVREIRDEIRQRVETLLREGGWSAARGTWRAGEPVSPASESFMSVIHRVHIDAQSP